MHGHDSLHADIRPHATCLKLHHRTTLSVDCLERKLSVAHSDHASMDELGSEYNTATEKLIAFESRHKGRHADEHALDSALDERKLHDARVYENYGKMADNTKKTFDGFCGRWIGFCEEKGYHMLDTTAGPGQEFLEQERLRHKSPGDNLKISFTQLKKLCEIRGCPAFSKDEQFFLRREVSQARKDSALAARSRPVDENKKQMDRSIISSADLQELLRVCADMPDRLAAARAAAVIKTSRLTGELAEAHSGCTLSEYAACMRYVEQPSAKSLLLQVSAIRNA